MPAKSAVLNFIQHNGFYGCCRCKQRGMRRESSAYFIYKQYYVLSWYVCIGKSVSCGSKGTVRVLPYMESDPSGPRRTHRETVDAAKAAASSDDIVSFFNTSLV